ncbi:MAG: TonB-dependent receptor [Acidobacteria bacterium]|nr:TonB-dependent receptor [Acidobacteriota bacterium]
MRLAFVFFVSVSLAAGADSCFVEGTIRDARGGELLRNVKIGVAGLAAAAVSGAQGQFRLPVPCAEITIQVSTVGYRTVRKTVVLTAAAPSPILDVILSPESLQRSDSIDVHAGPFELLRDTPPSSMTLSGAETKNLASVLADDPLRAVQALPGVSSNDDFDARFSLRGADFDHIGLYLDDILLHGPFHTVGGDHATGSLTIFNGAMAGDITLHSGSFPASFADRTAGILDVHTRDGSRSEINVRATASASNAAVMAEGPLGASKRGSWMAAFRKSYLQYLIRRTDTTNSSLAFGFLDGQARLAYDLTPRNTVTLSFIGGASDLDRSQAKAKLGNNSVMTGEYRFDLANLGWRYAPSEKLLVSSRLAYLREHYSNANPTGLDLEQGSYGEWTGRSDASWAWASLATLDFGASMRRTRADGYRNSFQSSVQRLEDFRGSTLRGGAYTAQSFRPLAGRIQLSLGARFDRQSADSVSTVSPTASLSLLPAASTRIQFGWGQYVQFPDLIWLYSKFGSPRLLPERALHFTAAIEQRLYQRTRIRAEFYQRQDRDVLFRSLYEPRIIAGKIFIPPAGAPAGNALRGYSRGMEIFLQRRSDNRVTGWISYALGYTGMRDGLTGARFPTDFDQRHTANVYLSYRLRPSVNLSGRWTYGSGFPIPGFLSKTGATYYLASARNQLRLDPYQRTDLRINKAYELSRCRLTLYGEVVNLTNRGNYRYDSFNSYNSRTGQANVGLTKMFPILPSIGIMVELQAKR